MKCPQPRLTDAHHRQLQEYDWPGNARELRNVIERAVINSGGGAFSLDFQGLAKNVPGTVMEDDSQVLSEQDLRRFERKNIEKALAQCGWKIYGENGAAALLGMQPSTLASRVQRMGIQKADS